MSNYEHAGRPQATPVERPLKPGQRVIVALRRMIASGELVDGARIGEVAAAAALGVSRMPVRTALRALEQEGLVVRLGARGYAARGPSVTQIVGAVEVRGVLEGLAAAQVAHIGLRAADAVALAQHLDEGDAIFANGQLDDGDLERFYAYNLAFHDLIVTASDNPAIAIALARNNHLPLASAAALAIDWEDRPAEYRHLLTSHRQHHAVAEAIRRRDAQAAEAIMRAHARAAIGSGALLQRIGTAGTTTL